MPPSLGFHLRQRECTQRTRLAAHAHTVFTPPPFLLTPFPFIEGGSGGGAQSFIPDVDRPDDREVLTGSPGANTWEGGKNPGKRRQDMGVRGGGVERLAG